MVKFDVALASQDIGARSIGCLLHSVANWFGAPYYRTILHFCIKHEDASMSSGLLLKYFSI